MSHARVIWYAQNCYLCYIAVMGYATNQEILFFHCISLPNHCAWFVGKGGTNMNRNVEIHTHLHGARLHYACTQTGHLQHFIIGNLLHPACIRHQARVCGVYAVNVGINLAGVSLQGTGQSHSGGIGTATAQGYRIALLVSTLETCHNHNLALFQLLADTGWLNIHNLALGMHGVGAHAHHRAGQGNRLLPQALECHGQKRNRHLLAGGQQHIHLTGILVRIAINALCQLNQVIRGIAHSGYHHDNLVTRLFLINNSLGNIHNLLSRAYRGTAKLFYN